MGTMTVPYTNDREKYLEHNNIIDYTSKNVSDLAELLFAESENFLDYIKNVYEYVRDRISHSADAGEDVITCSASEVLAAGHGICFAKSHLLAALLRKKGIPCGFCYQKLILDDETAPVLIYHGLNGVYLDELAQLYVETFNAEPWNDEWTFETARKRLYMMLHTDVSFGLCVYREGQMYGAVLGEMEQYYDGLMFEVKEYWVKNEMRGKGIGSKLFAELEKRLRERDVKNIILITAKGDATEHFYHKQGMETAPDMVFLSKRV